MVGLMIRKGFYEYLEQDLSKNGFLTQIIVDDTFIKLLAKHEITNKVINVFYDIIHGKYIIAIGSLYNADIQQQFEDPDEALGFYMEQLSTLKNDFGTDLSDLV